KRFDYLPFGEEILTGTNLRGSDYGDGATGNRMMFTGQLRDSESGLDYFGARYMSSGLGRFSSPDPKGAGADVQNPKSWNGYMYALNNPLAYVDPNGKWPFYVHNRIYEETFGGIFNSSEMKLVEQA